MITTFDVLNFYFLYVDQMKWLKTVWFCVLTIIPQTAFPTQEKRVDALMFYSTEIFTYIEENLKLTPQSLSDKATASDELEEMHQQVMMSIVLI